MTPPPRQRTYSVAKKDHGWSTEDELDYLRNMGRGLFGRSPRSHQSLLSQYAAALTRRTNWGALDAVAIRQAVETALQEEG